MTPTTNTSPATAGRYAVLDAERSGTLYFRTAAGAAAYIAEHRYAVPVAGSPASTADVLVDR